jgi:hypothetical protein
MMYYRVAIRERHSATWRWKSPLFTSLHGVLGMLHLYHVVPEERLRVFLFTSTCQIDAMLQRANQGGLTTTIAVKSLWDAHSTNWMEVRRLEIELGEGGDQNQPYERDLVLSSSETLGWTTLLARRACGELLS